VVQELSRLGQTCAKQRCNGASRGVNGVGEAVELYKNLLDDVFERRHRDNDGASAFDRQVHHVFVGNP
jgi:hypothetical protein